MLVFKTDIGQIEINGKRIMAHIHCAFEDDLDQPDFDYGNESENKAELARFESGELSNMLLKVTASALGETGTDVLGQVFVKTSQVESDLLSVANDHDMINNALIELKNNIIYQYKTLKVALE
jgi:hypothetical protein